uniref:DNA mismatch repair ATPase n=1 Tax=Pithovirus LCPAC403 TaxID=2506596 RepID=A0A481ZF58_9VIRU|nr:MAG: DNA mismatch repair ATPase [Pithovirus LCPAC403]
MNDEKMNDEKPIINKSDKISVQYQYVYDFYHKRLGDNVAVLMRCGSFYEVYSYGTDEDDQPNNAIEIANVMGIHVGYLPRSGVTTGNPWKGGFTAASLSKFRNKLLRENYSVIVCEEVPSNTSPKQRVTTSIQTPGVSTNVDGYRENNIICIHIENQNPKIVPIRIDTLELVIGVSCIDVSTGESQVFEVVSTYETIQSGELNAIEEIYRFLHSHNSRELIIHLTGFNISEDGTERKVRRYFKEILGLNNYYVYEFTINELNKDWTTAKYINKVLSLIYIDTIGAVGTSPLEFFGIQYILNAAAAFVTLIEHIRIRDEKLIYKLEHIQIWSSSENLVLTHNCQIQLSLIPRSRKIASEQISLFDIVNNTSTAMGSRLLESTILRPFRKSNVLELKYSQVSTMINLGSKFQANIGRYLKEIVDLQRYHRLIDVELLSPCKLLRLIQSYEAISHIICLIQKANTENESLPLPDIQTLDKFEEFRKTLNKIFNRDSLLECKSYRLILLNVFNHGINSEVDQLALMCGDVNQLAKQLATHFAYLVSPDIAKDRIFKLITPVNPVRGGRHFGVSHRVWGSILVYKRLIAEAKDIREVSKYFSIEDLYKAHHHEITDVHFINWGKKMMFKSSCEFKEPIEYLSIDDVQFVRSLNATLLKTKVKVYCDMITQSEISDQVKLDKFHKLMTISFHKVCQNIYSLNSVMLKTIIKWIANIDLINSNAITAQVNRYSRPCIVENSTSNSYIRAENIRNPIIERIQDDIPYIPNDVKIGVCEKDHSASGLLLFSINNAGKSSYLKAVGLNIILAQCGMYVSADSFEYAPFGNIITRLSAEDNMYRRQGTFAVEISELTTVISQSNSNTLVLADEVCRGTEYKSAYGLVSASVIRLCSKRVNFIFSTHLHAITNNHDVLALTEGDNPRLQYNHFTTILNEKTQEVIFEYKLREGIGENLYGIEIAELMGLDKATCELAYKYRNELMYSETHDIPLGGRKASKYNSKLMNGFCEISECRKPVKDTHHIIQQSKADENGYIDNFHKNSLFNLIGLCASHHHQQHHGKLKIIGKAMTTRGIKLLFEEN